MGSTWDYIIPYQENITAALAELRTQAFQEADYYNPDSADRFTYEHEGFRLLPEQRKHLRARLERRGLQQSPRSIEDVLQRNEGAGAHSILDIAYISAEASAGSARPLTATELQRLFHTTQPTPAQVERKLDRLWSLCATDQAIYIVVLLPYRKSVRQ
jgi:hypothetical protein